MRKKIVLIKKKNPSKEIFGIIIIGIIAVVSELSIPKQAIMQKIVWCLLAIVGIVLWITKRLKKETFNYSKVIIWNLVPFIIGTVYTVFYCSLVEKNLPVVKQSITTTFFLIVDVFMVLALAKIFKEKSIQIVEYGIVLSYLITMVMAINQYGFSQVIIDKINGVEAYFEKHDVGVSVVPLVIYYLYIGLLSKNKNGCHIIRSLVILLSIMLLCGKRCAYLALFLSMVILLIERIIRNGNIFGKVLLSVCILYCYFIVYIVKNGFLGKIFDIMNINSMGRVFVWNWFRNDYSLSPFYLGKGFQYIHIYMKNGCASHPIVNAFGYLHNSILQLYIELGFWGFFIWVFINLVIIPYFIRKKCGRETYLYYAILCFSNLIMITLDNLITYPLYQISYWISIFGIYQNEKQVKKNILEASSSFIC